MLLSEKETRLVKAYCTLPIIALASLLMIFGISGVLIVLLMIDGAFFDGYADYYWMDMYVFLFILGFFVVLFIYSCLRPVLGMRRGAWQEIVQRLEIYQEETDFQPQVSAAFGLGAAGSLMRRFGNDRVKKAGSVVEAAGGALTVGTTTMVVLEAFRNARAVAKAYGVSLPKARKYVLPLVFLPILLLICAFIPEYMSSADSRHVSQETAAVAVEKIALALEAGCERVSYDDPMERYQEYGYHVYGHLYGYDENDSYISVQIGNDGVIDKICYYIDTDVSRSQEETLKQAQADISTLRSLLLQADVQAADGLTDDYGFPEEFMEEFLAGSCYEEYSAYVNEEKVKVFADYYTVSEEQYNEYSHSYLALIIEARQ